MEEHFQTYSAVFPIILRTVGSSVQILLHRRQNTGFQDGRWDLAGSGHVDESETAKMAVVRECREELGIEVKTDDITFAHLSHRVGSPGGRTYYDIYFVVHKYGGTPAIMEPDKCSELEWFAIDALPDEIIEIRRMDLNHYRNHVSYSEKRDCL